MISPVQQLNLAAICQQVFSDNLPQFSSIYVYTDNYIDGSEFVKLTEQEVKEMIPAIGVMKKVTRLLPKI